MLRAVTLSATRFNNVPGQPFPVIAHDQETPGIGCGVMEHGAFWTMTVKLAAEELPIRATHAGV